MAWTALHSSVLCHEARQEGEQNARRHWHWTEESSWRQPLQSDRRLCSEGPVQYIV